MSSPAGLQFSQADFLARWMPNSSRAGVILGPCAGLSSAVRHTSAGGPDDSFVSDFAPLPASADSSCVALDGFPRPHEGDTAGSDRPLNGQSSDGESDSLDQMESQKQPPNLTMKLDQVRPASNRPPANMSSQVYLCQHQKATSAGYLRHYIGSLCFQQLVNYIKKMCNLGIAVIGLKVSSVTNV